MTVLARMPGHPAPLPLKATTPVPASNGKIINMARKKNYAEKRLSRLQDTTTEARTTFTVIDLKGINDLLGGGENRVAIREAVFERLASEPFVGESKETDQPGRRDLRLQPVVFCDCC